MRSFLKAVLAVARILLPFFGKTTAEQKASWAWYGAAVATALIAIVPYILEGGPGELPTLPGDVVMIDEVSAEPEATDPQPGPVVAPEAPAADPGGHTGASSDDMTPGVEAVTGSIGTGLESVGGEE